MDSIPSAQKFAAAYSAKLAEQKKVQHVQKLEGATSKFVAHLRGIFVKRIQETDPESGRVIASVNVDNLGVYDGIHGSVLLYGHHDRDTPFTQRKPLEISKTAFRRLQDLFYDSDWYLIEESDPEYGNSMVRFVLYSSRPGPNHYYFNKADRLWHNHNMFYSDEIEEVTEPELDPAAPTFEPPTDAQRMEDLRAACEASLGDDCEDEVETLDQGAPSGTIAPPSSPVDPELHDDTPAMPGDDADDGSW
jgi:hypothetical protein